jgi:hypothetical protein
MAVFRYLLYSDPGFKLDSYRTLSIIQILICKNQSGAKMQTAPRIIRFLAPFKKIVFLKWTSEYHNFSSTKYSGPSKITKKNYACIVD